MIDITKQYRTRDGREVRIYAVDGGNNHCVHGAVLKSGSWYTENWTIEGDYEEIRPSHPLDLIEVKPRIKRTVWLNVYPDQPSVSYGAKETADCGAFENRLACIKVEIDCEDGEGL